ncbi:hypothetical protein [Streptomyces sp. NPDC047141]|uniref:hypothetical protein n=1 Tax=Streptomyces sp. NPDC047141 TaxID=3155738 RepID=UPI0033F42825
MAHHIRRQRHGVSVVTLELRHRQRVRAEDRIWAACATGPRNLRLPLLARPFSSP